MHPENHYRLCVPGTRHAEVVWFSCTVPGATPSSSVFDRRHYRDFWWLPFVIWPIYLAVALILSGEMAVAYFKFHAPQGFWPLLNDGEGAVLYCFIFLYLASTGGGPWSFDRLLRTRAYVWKRQINISELSMICRLGI